MKYIFYTLGGLVLIFTLIMVGAWFSAPSETAPTYSYDFEKLISVNNIDSLRIILKSDTLIDYISKSDEEEPTEEQKDRINKFVHDVVKGAGGVDNNTNDDDFEWDNYFNIKKNNVECIVNFYPKTRLIKDFFISSRNTEKDRHIEDNLDMAVNYNLSYESSKYSIKENMEVQYKDLLLGLTITPK